MKKIYLTLCVLLAAVICAVPASAKQTLEEATDSIQEIYNNAKAGDPKAQTIVGSWYYQGRHVDQSYDQAVQWWAKAVKKGNAQAISMLGMCYRTGHGVKADSVKAMDLYTRSIKEGYTTLIKTLTKNANSGDVFSMVYLAHCYQKGLGVEKDVYKAGKLYEKAAEKGSVDASRELGLLLLNNKQAKEAYKYFQKAADKGDIPSTFYVGKLLTEGKGVAKDATKGMIYIQKAADAGFANGQLYLGNAFYSGTGVRKSPETGYSWILKAAIQGNTNAMYQVAMKEVAGDGTNLDYEQATLWFIKAVDNYHSKAFQKAFTPDGELYNSPYLTFLKARQALGEGNFEGAIKLAKALQKNKNEAISMTGTTLEGLVLCTKNNPKANVKKGVKLLEKAAAKGNATAQYILGGMYEVGNTAVTKDLSKATDLITSAAKLGNTTARCYLGNMLYEGRGVKKDFAKAVKCYLTVGPLINETAAKHLAACYENGYGGLDKDAKKAEEISKANYTFNYNTLYKLLPATK